MRATDTGRVPTKHARNSPAPRQTEARCADGRWVAAKMRRDECGVRERRPLRRWGSRQVHRPHDGGVVEVASGQRARSRGGRAMSQKPKLEHAESWKASDLRRWAPNGKRNHSSWLRLSLSDSCHGKLTARAPLPRLFSVRDPSPRAPERQSKPRGRREPGGGPRAGEAAWGGKKSAGRGQGTGGS